MSKEAMKLALEGAANYIDALGGDSRKYRQALAEQPAQHPKAKAIAECLAVLRPSVKGKFPHEQALEEIVGYIAAPQPAQQEPVAWLEILRNNKTATDEVIGAFLRGHAEHLTGETFVIAITPQAQPAQQIAESPDDWSDWRVIPPQSQPAPMIRGDIRDGLVDDEPAQRTWVGLTDKEITETFDEVPSAQDDPWWLRYARVIEAKLKEKNT